jgi:hypothetical protein
VLKKYNIRRPTWTVSQQSAGTSDRRRIFRTLRRIGGALASRPRVSPESAQNAT